MFDGSAPAGGELKYARRERERRFLFGVPPDRGVIRVRRMADRYLTGTRMRLRRETETTSAGGGTDRIVYKLTQKVPGHGGEPGLITTMYIDAAEYAVLTQLPALSLTKTRLTIPPLGVDVFEGCLTGLVIGEAEFADAEAMERFVPPPGTLAEVTHDHRLTGGSLAAMTGPELALLLAEYGVTKSGRIPPA